MVRMIHEKDIAEANGLVARLNLARSRNAPHATLFAIQLRLLEIGVQLENPVPADDPRAPPGGSAVSLRKAA